MDAFGGMVEDELGLLTVKQVAALFQVKPQWVYDEVEAGRLPSRRLGRRILRFSRADLADYLEAAGTSPTETAPVQPRPRAR